MRDEACVRFLQWSLPRLELRWAGFRKVRRQVCKRIQRRWQALGLEGWEAYRRRLEQDAAEWGELDQACRITISRFYRDRGVFLGLAQSVLPALATRAAAAAEPALRIWSAGCGSGEEAYSIALLWHRDLAPQFPALALQILATDVDPVLLERARIACYGSGSLKDLPGAWRDAAFTPTPYGHCLDPAYRTGIEFRQHDIRTPPPDGPYHLILCRNLAFTYFAPTLQQRVAAMLHAALTENGALVIGAHEGIPNRLSGFVPWNDAPCIFRKRG